MPAAPTGPWDTWGDVLESARESEPSRLRQACASILAAYVEATAPSIFSARLDGFPAGRPTKALAREAASELLAIATDRDEDAKRTLEYQALGLIHRWIHPMDRFDPGDAERGIEEVGLAAEATRQGVEVAERLGSPDILAWALYDLGVLAARAAEHQEATDVLNRCLDILLPRISAGDDSPPEFAAACGNPGWLSSGLEWRCALMVYAASKLQGSAASAGDYDSWTRAWQVRQDHGHHLAQRRPDLYGKCIQSSAARARLRGDRAAMGSAERRAAQLVLDTPPEERWQVERVLHAIEIGNAEIVKDWTRTTELQEQRLQWCMATAARQASRGGETIAEDADSVVDFLKKRGDRTWTAAIGNCALGWATGVWRSGAAASDEVVWARALAMLQLADRCYAEFGANGFWAIHLTRLRLQRDAPGGPRLSDGDLADACLEVSKRALGSGLRRNAVIHAATWAPPQHPGVLERIDEMLATDSAINGPRLRAARLTYQIRGADPDWRAVEPEALAVAAGLEPEGRLLDALLATDAWVVAARAAREIGRPPAVALERYLAAIRCLSVQLISITSTFERRQLASTYGAMVREAAEMAVALGDGKAAELIMESMRRDQVGTLLVSLIRDATVAASVRQIAESLQSANAAVPDVPGQVPQGEVRSWMRHASLEVDASQERAARAARAVIGPLAALADSRTLTTSTASTLLDEAWAPGRAIAVWQLLPANGGLLRDDTPAGAEPSGSVRVFWSVAFAAPDGRRQQDCGVSELEITAEDLQPPDVFVRSFYISETLMPATLKRFLLRYGVERPVDLVIVPTGLLGVPFDALVVDATQELQVVDLATTSVVGSVATAIALRHSTPASPVIELRPGQPPNVPARREWLTTYDTSALQHTTSEREAVEEACVHLNVEHPVPRRADTADEFLQALPDASLVSLGVHGMDDRATGWGQCKVMPDGSLLFAADVLRADAPPLWVMASCHTSLVAADDIELGGFPMAALLRGALCIIGSIAEVPDDVTARMMRSFWSHLTSGASPLEALRAGKVDVLRADPRLRTQPQQWAAMVAYGTTVPRDSFAVPV